MIYFLTITAHGHIRTKLEPWIKSMNATQWGKQTLQNSTELIRGKGFLPRLHHFD